MWLPIAALYLRYDPTKNELNGAPMECPSPHDTCLLVQLIVGESLFIVDV